jgi:hypothetical protein
MRRVPSHRADDHRIIAQAFGHVSLWVCGAALFAGQRAAQ